MQHAPLEVGNDLVLLPNMRLRLRDGCVAAVVTVLSIILLVPVDGLLPGESIDLSWPYVLADATARHIPFGRDIVFTFGPLAPVYTRFFLPDQRLAFTVLKVVLVAAVCLATVAVSRRPLRLVALTLPFVIANLFLVDAFFLVAPWVIVPLATTTWRSRSWQVAGLVALSAVLGPLLLVKGTLAIPLVACIGAAALAASRRSLLEAIALPCAAAVSIMVAWMAAGQHLADLPLYLRREVYVAEGYTDAMSSFGDPREIWIYLAGAAALLGTQAASRAPWASTVAGAVVLFVAFKAGFVRHDEHAMIAGSVLAFFGLLMFLNRGDVASGVGLLAGLAAWVVISANHWPVDPGAMWGRLASALGNASVEIRGEAGDLDEFRRSFENGKADLGANPLPATNGTVDLYPNDAALLLASGRDYYPRPVIQSYSAYTPQLASIDAKHLQGAHAPKTAFLTIDPIDGRYPAQEDGPSWPALLGQYRFRSFWNHYAVLDRVEGAAVAAIDPPTSEGSYVFGDPIAVPSAVPFVWVSMRFHPTVLGRAASILFKRPALRLDVITSDGRSKSFRLIAGMASAGFLLSPTVSTAHDFVALRSTAADVLTSRRVTSITVRQEGRHGLWGERFDLRLAPLRISPDPRVDDAVLSRVDDSPTVSGATGGQ